MYATWDQDLKDSVKALEKIKEKYLSQIIAGRIHTIESKEDEILMLLDIKSGIDYIRENETGLQGIAARCQWCDPYKKPFNTFTIRLQRHSGAETEFEKRKNQIKNGYFYPAFTLQAYFDNKEENNLLSVGIVKTLALYDFIEKNRNMIKEKKSDNTFLVIKWSDLCGFVKTIILR
jgi:hypothetical protein